MRRSESKMKLTQQRTSRYDNTPESLTDWLEEQLDSRGIDAVVYTRYILSLLLEDSSDSDTDDSTGSNTGISSVTTADISRCSCKQTCSKTSTKWKHKRYLKQINANHNNNNCVNGDTHWLLHSECCLHREMNGDEERKLAVVQCLKSASEQEFGIESFVDELCAKLKTIKALSETSELSSDPKSDVSNNNGIKASPKDMAMKYYAAFPALHTDTQTVSKADTIEIAERPKNAPKNPSNKYQWNGQKIIEFISSGGTITGAFDGNRLLHGLTADSDGDTSQPTLTTDTDCPENDDKPNPQTSESRANSGANEGNKQTLETINAKVFYCRDIESKTLNTTSDALNTFLVVNSTANVNTVKRFVDCNGEETDKFQRLVDKFNSNIASIWTKPGTDGLPNKNDNIWSFDSSFSSNQSSATPSPKPNAIDIWSSMPSNDSNERLARNTAPTALEDMYSMHGMNWESNLLKSINVFPDDGFIDGNHDLIDEESVWLTNNTDKLYNDSSLITLENHQKNSPFIEFNSLFSSTPKASEKDCSLELSKLLSMVSLLNQSKHHLSPPPEENLLTSPKTHFQPIKHDSFERDDSDEGSVPDITDNEVKKLVICSDKCPNNGDKLKESEVPLKCRPVSTSLDELASFMGPFNDLEFGSNEFLTSLPISEEMEFTIGIKESQMSDKWTNTETEIQTEVKSKLEPILESEPEYQDLYNMINEVLRNGIVENDSLVKGCSSSVAALDDWYDSDYDNCNDLVATPSREKRLSWNYYWDTYDISSATKSQFSTESETPFKDDKVVNSLGFGSKFAKKSLKETTDEAFGDELFYNNSRYVNCSLDECPEYEEVFDDYGLLNDNEFDDFHAVYGENECIDGENSSEYLLGKDVVGGDVSSLGQKFDLQLKPRYSEASKRVRKPCSFFIEGNCKRSDCKYSHDISAITCKYWEEGFCFKAELCPFLHGYADEQNIIKTKPLLSKLKKSYAIESESDFPSLAILPNSEDNTPALPDVEPPLRVEQHFFDFRTKSVVDSNSSRLSKAKLPITVVMKKKVKKRKDRNLQ